MKKLITTILITLFLSFPLLAQAGTVASYPNGAYTVNLATYDLETSYHAQIDFTADANYITIINSYGNAFVWGFVEYDAYGNEYLYISDDGYNFYYCP